MQYCGFVVGDCKKFSPICHRDRNAIIFGNAGVNVPIIFEKGHGKHKYGACIFDDNNDENDEEDKNDYSKFDEEEEDMDMRMVRHGEGVRPRSLEAYRQRQMFLHSYKFTRRKSPSERVHMHVRKVRLAWATCRHFYRKLQAKLKFLSDYINFHRSSFFIVSKQMRPSLIL